MKKILFGEKKGFYKANLHCHSTVSDGRKTPEELKKMYMERGYSIIAFTDHDVLIEHSDLNDKNFLALNGYEMEISEPRGENPLKSKTCHLCFIALAPDNLTQVCYHREWYIWGNATEYRKFVKFDETKPDFIREHTPECINKIIEEGRKNGFFVTYNHPSWSMETLEDYGAYKGMNAMEICNYGCYEVGYTDYNEKEYDEMLRGGQKIFCVSTDDNHNARNDSFGGFTVINADGLEYTAITDALVKGNFYASQGPKINRVWYEDGKIGIECSEAVKVVMNTCGRRTAVEDNAPVTSAVFDIKEFDEYVRLTVTDASGNHANTSAYFVEDLIK